MSGFYLLRWKFQKLKKNQSYSYGDCLMISYERYLINRPFNKLSKKTDVDYRRLSYDRYLMEYIGRVNSPAQAKTNTFRNNNVSSLRLVGTQNCEASQFYPLLGKLKLALCSIWHGVYFFFPFLSFFLSSYLSFSSYLSILLFSLLSTNIHLPRCRHNFDYE